MAMWSEVPPEENVMAGRICCILSCIFMFSILKDVSIFRNVLIGKTYSLESGTLPSAATWISENQ